MRKKKRLNDIYMREVTKRKIKTIWNEELNSYITYKHVLDTSHVCKIYINGKKVALVGKNYTILEYSPIDEQYNVRVFINDEGNIIQYYFDIISSTSFENGEVYFDDLFLDILYDTPYSSGQGYYISIVDENELLAALNNNEITKEEYDRAYDVANKIMKELREGNNKFVNRKEQDFIYLKNYEE